MTRRTIWRALAIVVAGSALGLLVNAFSPRRIAYITPPPPARTPADEISLTEATGLWRSGRAFFLDARAEADYAAGHIAGAISLPSESFDKRFPEVSRMLPTGAPLVAYCDGQVCELSHQLAEKLRLSGYRDVRVLVNGWTDWKTARLPTQTGAGS